MLRPTLCLCRMISCITAPRCWWECAKFSHTYKNIIATGEFVVNFPSAEFLDDVMETSRFYREGISELEPYEIYFSSFPEGITAQP